MTNNSDNDKKFKDRLRQLEKERDQLKRELEKERTKRKRLERENKDLKEILSKIVGSAPMLAVSDKTAEAGGVPSSKIYYRRNRQEGTKKHTGGQPGHQGHGRKRPKSNRNPIPITLKTCPECNNALDKPVKNAEQQRTITDIPLPDHIVYEVIYKRYYCKKCKKMVRGDTPWLPPKQHFGPAVACWIAYQRMLGLSTVKIQSSLFETYGLTMSEATILKLEKWVSDILQEDYDQLKEEVKKADSVGGDETGFRVGGENGWLWVFSYTLGALYVVAPTRGHDIPEQILEGFEGVLGRDSWKSYDQVKCSAHQLDLLHVNRWLERAEIKHGIEPRTILSSKPVTLNRRGRPPEKFIEFVNGVRSILKRAIEYSEKKPPPPLKQRKIMATKYRNELKSLIDREWNDKDAIRIAKELRRRRDMLFTFVINKNVPWHNNNAERDIRQGVLHRKISGGRRTWAGAEVFEILLSISETAKKRGNKFIDLVKAKLFQSSENGTPEIFMASKS